VQGTGVVKKGNLVWNYTTDQFGSSHHTWSCLLGKYHLGEWCTNAEYWDSDSWMDTYQQL